MARLLKQSTAFTFRVGPFLDSTDGVTAETGLTIAQADMQISKTGGAFAQTSASPTTTHDADGWYQCPLTTTDTATLGTLTVQIVMAGALPVWEHFMVVTANVWDTYCSTDQLDVNVTNVAGTSQTANDNGADINAILTDTAVIGALGAGLTGIPWNAAWDAEVQSECADALTAYDPPTRAELTSDIGGLDTKIDTIDGIVDNILVDTGTTLDGKLDTIDGIVDSILVDTGTTLDAAIAVIDGNVDSILADTGELQTDWVNGGRLDLLLDACSTHSAADVWDATSATLSINFETIVDRLYRFLMNKMNITDADGSVALRNEGDGADIMTQTITDNDTTTVRTATSWV